MIARRHAHLLIIMFMAVLIAACATTLGGPATQKGQSAEPANIKQVKLLIPAMD